jgi:hypothetical protein
MGRDETTFFWLLSFMSFIYYLCLDFFFFFFFFFDLFHLICSDAEVV